MLCYSYYSLAVSRSYLHTYVHTYICDLYNALCIAHAITGRTLVSYTYDVFLLTLASYGPGYCSRAAIEFGVLVHMSCNACSPLFLVT